MYYLNHQQGRPLWWGGQVGAVARSP